MGGWGVRHCEHSGLAWPQENFLRQQAKWVATAAGHGCLRGSSRGADMLRKRTLLQNKGNCYPVRGRGTAQRLAYQTQCRAKSREVPGAAVSNAGAAAAIQEQQKGCRSS